MSSTSSPAFNRPAFEAQVSQKSPLTVEQFDKCFDGSITAENKSTAWALMNLPAQDQFLVWQAIKAFPGAYVDKVK